MMARVTPDQALISFRNARILWAGHSESRKAVEQQIESLLTAMENQQIMLDSSNYSGTSGCAEMVNCAARECIYSQHQLMEACTEDALSNFMQANGAALTSALAPFLKGRGGLTLRPVYYAMLWFASWQ